MRSVIHPILAVSLLVCGASFRAPSAPTAWTFELPGTFIGLAGGGFHTGFEAGVLPPEMATTAVDAVTGLPDPDAWCRIGTGIYSTTPYDGVYDFEFGFDPGSAHGWHDVRNALVIGFDGTGHPGPLQLAFKFRDLGEDSQPVDGVWLSTNGTDWTHVQGTDGTGASGFGWVDWPEGASAWGTLSFDLAAAAAANGWNLYGPFYVAIAEEDNLPLGFEGVLIDELELDFVPGGSPVLSVTNLVAGQTSTLTIQNAGPGDLLLVAFSVTGGGPASSPFGTVFLSSPLFFLPLLTADGSGLVSVDQFVPLGTTGIPLWLQALDVTSGELTNGVAEVIQ